MDHGSKEYEKYRALVEEANPPPLYAAQDPEEFATFLVWLLARRELNRILEIGTYFGGTLWVLAHAAEDDAVLVSVELGHSAVHTVAPDVITRAEQQVHLLSGDSHDRATLAAVEQCLDGHQVDLLLIDADHTYPGVKQDWEMYTPLVAPGGVVALHDAVDWGWMEGRSSELEVWKFWEELTEEYPDTTRLFARPGTAGLGTVVFSRGETLEYSTSIPGEGA